MSKKKHIHFIDETNASSYSLRFRLLSVSAVLVILVMVFCLYTLHSNEEEEPESETESLITRDTAAIPAGPLDGIMDDEVTTGFSPDFRSNYLSGALVASVHVVTPVDSYIEIKTEQENTVPDVLTSSGLTGEEGAASETESQETEPAHEVAETNQADPDSSAHETLPAQTETETGETDIMGSSEAETAQTPADPRETVWSHYPNLGVIVAPNYLHIRTAPSLEGAIIGILFRMSGVNLLELSADGQWYRIVSNGIEGYINAEFVATGEEAKALAYENAFPAVTVKAEVLNVRQEPSTDSKILTQIIAGSLYVVSEETNENWLKIIIGSEIEGYVAREFVTYDYALQDAVEYVPEPEEELPSINPVRLEIVNNAMQYLGGAYVWGGTTLGVGVDCSGFMLRIFEQYGYSLPRTSYWQVNAGVPVSFEEMQPGDLIFYWNNSLGRVGHVALYMGNNLIVHAASEQRGIVIDDYRFMTPYCARNIIGE